MKQHVTETIRRHRGVRRRHVTRKETERKWTNQPPTPAIKALYPRGFRFRLLDSLIESCARTSRTSSSCCVLVSVVSIVEHLAHVSEPMYRASLSFEYMNLISRLTDAPAKASNCESVVSSYLSTRICILGLDSRGLGELGRIDHNCRGLAGVDGC